MALPRGFRIYLPLGEVGIAFFASETSEPGGAKYKISVPDGNRNETHETRQNDFVGLVPLWLASGIVVFKNFFISSGTDFKLKEKLSWP